MEHGGNISLSTLCRALSDNGFLNHDVTHKDDNYLPDYHTMSSRISAII